MPKPFLHRAPNKQQTDNKPTADNQVELPPTAENEKAEETKQRDKGEDVQRRTPTGRLCAGHDRAAEYAVCRVFQKIPAGSEVEKRWPLELEAKEEKKEKKHATSQALAASYIGNKNSKKFHLSDCSGQKRLLWGTGSRDEAIKAWYEPCKVCKP